MHTPRLTELTIFDPKYHLKVINGYHILFAKPELKLVMVGQTENSNLSLLNDFERKDYFDDYCYFFLSDIAGLNQNKRKLRARLRICFKVVGHSVERPVSLFKTLSDIEEVQSFQRIRRI